MTSFICSSVYHVPLLFSWQHFCHCCFKLLGIVYLCHLVGIKPVRLLSNIYICVEAHSLAIRPFLTKWLWFWKGKRSKLWFRVQRRWIVYNAVWRLTGWTGDDAFCQNRDGVYSSLEWKYNLQISNFHCSLKSEYGTERWFIFGLYYVLGTSFSNANTKLWSNFVWCMAYGMKRIYSALPVNQFPDCQEVLVKRQECALICQKGSEPTTLVKSTRTTFQGPWPRAGVTLDLIWASFYEDLFCGGPRWLDYQRVFLWEKSAQGKNE